MFYELQPENQREEYKKWLRILGSLSGLFSESEKPYLYYRAHERVFAKAFEAEDRGRMDCSADATKDRIGLGLKTWVDSSVQKVAEFGLARPQYEHLTGLDLVKRISELRNERIELTKRMLDLDTMEYSIVRRDLGVMQIMEHTFDTIDIDNITLIDRGRANSLYFTDGNHVYNFLKSKHTLYMEFSDLVEVDRVNVEILEDPFEVLSSVEAAVQAEKTEEVCLRLYSTRRDGTKFVPERSGLNQWNANGRARDPDEVYIPFPAADRERYVGFFPDRDTPFTLVLPDKQEIVAKVCQDGGKAIMSNPNLALGHWLLRQVLGLKERELLTYSRLEVLGIDSVIITKLDDLKYKIDFAGLGSYEDFCNLSSNSLDDSDTN